MQDRFWLEADRRPDGVDDDTVEAVGKLSEAVECIERARGALYDFHQLSGHADLLVGEAVEMLREAGQGELAGLIDRELVGRKKERRRTDGHPRHTNRPAPGA